MSKITHFIQQSWLLIVAAFFFGLLIAVTNAAWQPRIIQNEVNKLNNLMAGLITTAQKFEIAEKQIELTGEKGKIIKTDIYKALGADNKTLGFAFVASGPGFADKIKLVVAVNQNFENFFGFKVLASNETPGFGSKIKEEFFANQFENAPAKKLILTKIGNEEQIDDQIVAISGATVSSEAVVKIINNFITQIKDKMQNKD
jgi:electron transport complex protein RnfG